MFICMPGTLQRCVDHLEEKYFEADRGASFALNQVHTLDLSGEPLRLG